MAAETMVMPAMEVAYTEALEVQRLLYNRIRVLSDRRDRLPDQHSQRYRELSIHLRRLDVLFRAFRDHALAIHDQATRPSYPLGKMG